MNKVIVTTTINPPTRAIRLFDSLKDWHLIVVGDKKTPPNYQLKRGTYFSPEEQEKFDKRLSDLIGWNSIQRRNFGFLLANKMNADIIATIDDDNIPYKNWGSNLLIEKKISVNYYKTKLSVFDPIGATNYKNLWHRGFPLSLIPLREYANKSKKILSFDVQADFWNGDPDVDAICRMQYLPDCNFTDHYFPLTSNKISPFNSQNTFLSKKILKDYFVFPHVGRMDDIWASFYVQAKGFKVVYAKPSVYQKRNVHDLIKDMKNEYLGYENNLTLVKDLKTNPENLFKYMPEKSLEAFKLYKKHFK